MTQRDQDNFSAPFIAPQDSPAWFIENLRHPGQSVYAHANGGRIHCLAWNWDKPTLPVLMLVHGFTGHAHWWSYLAPFFTDRYRVLAVDLPGMGDSEALAEYTESCFAEALLAIVDQHQLDTVTLVAHSFGGGQAIRAMAMQPDAFAHGIIVDSYITLPPEPAPPLMQPRQQHRYRQSQDQCITEFRLRPPQPSEQPAILHYVAFHSCQQDSEGWRWKFDPGLRNLGEARGPDLLNAVTTPVDFIYGEHSMFNVDNKPQRVLQHFPQAGQLIIIPDAYHHLMIDHPLQLVEGINRLL